MPGVPPLEETRETQRRTSCDSGARGHLSPHSGSDVDEDDPITGGGNEEGDDLETEHEANGDDEVVEDYWEPEMEEDWLSLRCGETDEDWYEEAEHDLPDDRFSRSFDQSRLPLSSLGVKNKQCACEN